MLPSEIIADRFEIDRLVGEGGMGVVYRAIDRTTGAPVALKLVSSLRESGETDQRFAREIRLLAGLDHPRIARYVGHGVASDGRAFLAMQWLDGHDLATALAAGPLSLADAVRVLRGAAEAMAAVHAQGIVHRDFKPSNLFLRGGSSDDLVLLDFGVSRRRDASALLTGTAMVGTPYYMAPEQVSTARDILPAADVFSIGCVFYECLTAIRPFEAAQLYGVLARILYHDPEPPHLIDPSIPEAWSELLARMLHKQPARRPADGAALLSEIALLPPAPAEPASAARRSPAVAVNPDSSDQVLVCVVLATPADAGDELPALVHDRLDAVRSALRRFGCAIERLPNGSLLATVLPRHSATDLVHIAARCAMYLREQMPGARISVATGRAPLGPGTRIGEAVDRAANLLDGATTGEGIRLDDLTRELLAGRFITESRDGVGLLLGERADFDDSRPLLGRPTPCVGRELELIQLEGVMSSAVDDGMRKAAVVVGLPGMGKSRLRHELLRRLPQRHPQATVLVGYGDPLSAGSPYVLLADALRRHAGIRAGDQPAAARARLTGELGRHVSPADQRRVVEFLGELAGVPFPSEHSAPLAAARGDHRVMNEQIGVAFLDWVSAECAAHPLVLVLEDLQWGDALTVKLVGNALRDLGSGALFVLALGRPEVDDVFPKLLGEQRALTLSLRALSPKASELLVRGVLGDAVSGESVERIVRQAAGNALFLEELIRAAAGHKAGEVPGTVLAILQARLSRLHPEARLVLRAASVLGETFWGGGVRRICETWGAREDPEAWLTQLIQDELVTRLRTSRFPDEVGYAFRHALVCDAAGGLLADADRRSGHLAAGAWLEAAGETDGVVLARHAEEGGDVERAIAFYARAAQQSIGQYDFGGALARAGKGIALGARGPTLGELRAVKASALFSTGQWTGAAETGLSALELVPHGGVTWCRAVEELMQVLPNVGEPARSAELSDELLRMEPTPEVRTAYLRAVTLQLLGYAISGQHARGQACLDFIDRLGVPDDDLMVRGYARLYQAVFTFILGDDLAHSLELSRQAARDLAESQVMYRLSLAHTVQSFVWWGLGDHQRSESAARAGRSTAREIHDDYHAALADWYLALTLSEDADPAKLDEAQQCADTMVALDRSAIFLAAARVVTAGVALARHDWAHAESEARAARAGLTAMPPYGLMASAHLMTALVTQGRAAEAAAIAREDLARHATRRGPVCSEVLFLVAAAEALFAAGSRGEAESALRQGLRQIDVRARKLSDPALKQSFLLGRNENLRARAHAKAWLGGA
ncbi:MAG TPA: protein kinase [Polyangia bacterium]|nr:protein kinase [Polyangia bacterium]